MNASDPFPDGAEEEAEDDLWLISYADLLTLLIAFFVLLVASAPGRPSAIEALASSLGNDAARPLQVLQQDMENLVASKALQDSVVIRESRDGLDIELRDAVLFDSGSAELREDAQALLGQMATLLADLPKRPIVIEGHTDDLPIHTARFRSNWELGAARAIHVLEALEHSGLERKRLSIRSFADTRPASGSAPVDELRAQSRRVIIRVE